MSAIEVPRFIAKEVLEMYIVLEPLQGDFQFLRGHGLVGGDYEVVGEA